MRELSHLELPPPLIAWVHERLEWAAANLLGSDTDAVLVLDVDLQGEAQVSLDDCIALPPLGEDDLLIEDGFVKGISTGEGVWPATVWLATEDGTLIASAEELFLAVDTLAEQLATTQGIPVTKAIQTTQVLKEAQAVFAVSDEFGFVPLRGSSEVSDTIKGNLDKVFVDSN